MPEVGNTEQRKLAAIMFTDMVGYSALSQRNDKLALELLEEHRRLLREIFPRFNGTEIKTIGDAFLVEFNSALEAAQCAIAIQRALAKRNADAPADRQIELRIGIHIGDVVHREGDVYGDGVNIASRIQPLANAGGVCVSMDVERQIRNAIDTRFEKLAPTELKNISLAMDLFRIVLPWERPGTPVAKTETSRSANKKWILAAAAIALALAIIVGWFVFQKVQTDRPAARKGQNIEQGRPGGESLPVPEKSIAVLPFENLSRDPENAYFADGIQEEILTRLAKIADLKVISHTSTARYKSSPNDLREVATQLGVAHIIEGSVQRAADRVRVNVQLIKAANDAHVWAETYDRNLNDIFAVESEIARRIADALQAKLSGPEERALASRPTDNAEAHQLYLKGRYFWNKRTADGIERSINYFNQAIEIDSAYAPAYAGLADAYAILPNYSQLPGKDAYPKAEAAARRALELDENAAEAHVSLANVRLWSDWGVGAEPEFKRGLELNPNYSSGHQWYSIYLSVTGRLNEAIAEMKKAQELDPFSIIINTEVGCPYLYAKQYDKAIEQFEKAIEMDPNFAFAHFALAEGYDRTGRYKEALVEHDKAIALAQRANAIALTGSEAPQAWSALAGRQQNSYRALGGPGYWKKRLESTKDLHERGSATAKMVAEIYGILGDKEQTFGWLEKSYQEHDGLLVFLRIQPEFEEMRSEPGFQALLKKLSLDK